MYLITIYRGDLFATIYNIVYMFQYSLQYKRKGKVIIMFAYPPAPPAINSFGGEVSNVEEVRRARVDPCGSLTFFISKKENRVYVKYIDLSGLPVIEVYEKAKGQEESLNERLKALEEKVDTLIAKGKGD